MTDIADFITARLDEAYDRAELAQMAVTGSWDCWEVVAQQLAACCDTVPNIDRVGQLLQFDADPARVLVDIAAKHRLLAEVMSWTHAYNDEDSWHSCSQAIYPHEVGALPGSGCGDDARAGEPCDCGLDKRRAVIVNALAAPFADHPDYNPACSVEA